MSPMEHSLRFLGGAGTVTGSKFVIDSGGSRVLVDCGLFQGYKELRLRNREAFPLPPSSLDAALITHAHIDHSGYLPALVRDGFEGPILATDATRALSTLLLPDSAYLMEEEAEYARKKGYSKHVNPTPLYTGADAEAALAKFRTVERERSYEVAPGITASWHQAGHIIGASSISVKTPAADVYFSGDLGTNHDALMRPPQPFPGSDILVVESTYGNRKHAEASAEDQLAEVVGPVVSRGGVVLIPAFAVGRTQTVLLHLSRLMDAKRIPETRIFVNSPMAVNASEMYAHFVEDQKIKPAELERVYERTTLVRSVDQSIALNQSSGPMIIISAAGMLTGGRVLHHLMAFGQSDNNAIVLSGFQAGGTRGADLVAGKRTLRMFGEEIEITAPVYQVDAMSAHADADGLLEWMAGAPTPPRMTYLVHGEADASEALAARIEQELGWKARAAQHHEEIDLTDPV